MPKLYVYNECEHSVKHTLIQHKQHSTDKHSTSQGSVHYNVVSQNKNKCFTIKSNVLETFALLAKKWVPMVFTHKETSIVQIPYLLKRI